MIRRPIGSPYPRAAGFLALLALRRSSRHLREDLRANRDASGCRSRFPAVDPFLASFQLLVGADRKTRGRVSAHRKARLSWTFLPWAGGGFEPATSRARGERSPDRCYCLLAIATVRDFPPLEAPTKSASCVCVGRNGSGQVALPFVIRSERVTSFGRNARSSRGGTGASTDHGRQTRVRSRRHSFSRRSWLRRR